MLVQTAKKKLKPVLSDNPLLHKIDSQNVISLEIFAMPYKFIAIHSSISFKNFYTSHKSYIYHIYKRTILYL